MHTPNDVREPEATPYIEEPYLLFRLLDQRAIAILMAATSLIFVGPRLVSGGEVTVHMDHC